MLNYYYQAGVERCQEAVLAEFSKEAGVKDLYAKAKGMLPGQKKSNVGKEIAKGTGAAGIGALAGKGARDLYKEHGAHAQEEGSKFLDGVKHTAKDAVASAHHYLEKMNAEREKQASMSAFFSSKKFKKAKAALKNNKMRAGVAGLGMGAAAVGAAGMAYGRKSPVDTYSPSPMDKEGSMTPGASDMPGQAADKAREYAGRAGSAIQSGYQSAKGAVHGAIEAAKPMAHEALDQAQAHPMAAAGIGAAGLLGGGAALASRRASQGRAAELAAKLRAANGGHIMNHAGKIGLGLAAAGGLGYMAGRNNK